MMKNLLTVCLAILCMIGVSYSQTGSWAKVIIPPGQEFEKSEDNQLQIWVSGIPNSAQSIRSYTVNISGTPGVNYFNMIIQPDETEGYCDLRFTVSSKEEFAQMMKDIFCKLQLQSYIVNETTFENCQQVVIP